MVWADTTIKSNIPQFSGQFSQHAPVQHNPLKNRDNREREMTNKIHESRRIKIASSRLRSLLLGRSGAGRGTVEPGYPTGPVGFLVRSLVILRMFVFFFLVLTNKSQGP
jgi:hypothetical protein